MNDIEKFKQYDLKNTIYDYIDCYVVNDVFCGLNVHGNLNDEKCEHHHYNMYFNKIKLPIDMDQINRYQNGKLKDISVTGNKDDDFRVYMEIENPEGGIVLTFQCENCNIDFLRYRGIDYTNVYVTDKYKDLVKQYLYLENEKYFEEEKVVQITDEFSLVEKSYLHADGIRQICLSRNFLQRNGKTIYSYLSIDGHHNSYKELIYHRNGHRYYPYHVDLYGISYIDVDTLEKYNYIPRGYDNNYGVVCGESFIITNLYYDPNTNLVAYEGCYWAGTFDVMVGDLTHPLNFNPHLVSVHEWLDPEYEEFEFGDIDFEKWNENSLTVKIDSNEFRDVKLNSLLARWNNVE